MKKVITTVFLFSFIMICISCGIDEIPFLSRPEFGSNNDIDDYFEFKATEDNGGSSEDEFRGFEVYYKFYSYNEEGENTAKYQSNYTSVEELEASGFRRVTYYIDDNDCDKPTRILKPLIKVPTGMRGTETTITINFKENVGKGPIYSISSDSTGYISLPEPTPGPTPEGTAEPSPVPALPVRRGVEDDENPGYYKGFNTFKKTDPDVANLVTLDMKRVYIQIYILSYGIYNLSEQIYSDALCLRYIDLMDLNIEEE